MPLDHGNLTKLGLILVIKALGLLRSITVFTGVRLPTVVLEAAAVEVN
jgi:hypothetical protein